jgi:hypothetical protein
LVAIFLGFMAFKAAATTYYVNASGANPTPPYSSWSTAATNIQNAVDLAANGDLVLVTNGVYQPAGEPAPDSVQTCVICTNAVTIQSVNGSAATVINGSGLMRCVYLGNGVVFSGFTVADGNATNIYPYSTCGGVCCETNALVENCLIINNSAYYAGGLYFGTASNCVISGNVSIGSGGGAEQSTLINCTVSGNSTGYIDDLNAVGVGGGVMYCYLTNCVLTGNSSPDEGGGALSSTLNNCTLNNNSSWVGAGAANCSLNNCLVFSNSASTQYFGYSALTAGGGVAYGSANNCIILGNVVQLDERSSQAEAFGGGAYETALNNCTVVDNGVAGGYGGGAYGGSAYNSIIYYNEAIYQVSLVGAGNVTNVTLNYSCTFPTPTSGSGYFNFTNVPLFVSISGTGGNLHLQSNSPCINAGNNAYAVGATDLDGNPRIAGGTVDIGVYEYQTPKSAISYAYLQQYGLPTDGSVDFKDLDGSPYNVYQDWIAGLNPTNFASVLAMMPLTPTNNASGITVSWQSVSGILYNVQRSTNLSVQPPFSTIKSNITGRASTTSYTDTSATNGTPYFYRVGVP